MIACRDVGAAEARFGARDGKAGVVISRRGRAFFDDVAAEAALVARVFAGDDADVLLVAGNGHQASSEIIERAVDYGLDPIERVLVLPDEGDTIREGRLEEREKIAR